MGGQHAGPAGGGDEQPFGKTRTVAGAPAVWKGVQERRLVVALKAPDAARGADAAGPVPHHVGVPEALHPHRVEVDAVVVPQAPEHGQRAAHAFGPQRGVGHAQQQPVMGRRARHQPFQAAAGRQQAPPGLARQVHDVQQHPRFGDHAALAIGVGQPAIELAKAQRGGLARGGDAQPGLLEGAQVVAHRRGPPAFGPHVRR